MAARPTAWKYGAHSEPASHLDVGVKAVMLTAITARRWPSDPGGSRNGKKKDQETRTLGQPGRFQILLKPTGQTLILPRRHQVPRHQARQVKRLLEEARVSRLNGGRQHHYDDDPVRAVHAAF